MSAGLQGLRLGCGVDMVSVARIRAARARLGEAFAERILTPAERDYCRDSEERLAGRFAAKEAVFKALGTGFWQSGVGFGDVEVLPDALGAPRVRLSGAAEALFRRGGGLSIALSLSHEGDAALAFCTMLFAAETLL